MYNLTRRILPLLMLTVIFSNCKKKAFDEYYARPEGLQPPIYQTLESKGNFKSLLALIDKAGYKNILNSAGYWTMFAPNDEAFTKFYQERGIASIDAVDSTAARAIVQYLLVYNAFDRTRIDDYQSNAGWLPDQAFRRRTAFYTGFYRDTTASGQTLIAIQSNRNGSGAPYVPADNNNKYVPYFTDIFINGKNLTPADYKYFYPNSDFTGFNVADAKVVNQNITAENGIVHEIDKVISPLPSIDEYLRTRPEYSEFKKLYDKYMVSFIFNNDATNRYKLTGGKEDVYVKVYNSLLAFSLNNENYTKIQDNDAQQNGFTLFAPRNAALLSYVNSVILEHFKTFDLAPSQVIADFLNAHMWMTPVWPSKFNSTFNFLGEEARFNPQTDVVDRKMLSNGIFYGTNKVQEANVFSSVYAKAYLDPKFSLMTRLLDVELKFNITSPRQKLTLFLVPDAVFAAAGYAFNSNSNTWSYTPPGGTLTSGEAIRQRLLRIVHTSMIPAEIPSLAGSGIAEAYNNEFIKWNNNQVISAGTQDGNQVVRVDSAKTTQNGRVYYLNGLLNFTEVNIGFHIRNLGGTSATTSQFYNFWKYLESSALYNATTGEITGTAAGTFYTVFVPRNAAIEQAVKDGVLPGNRTTGVPSFNPASAVEKEQVNRFILYHILNKRSIIPDGKESGGFESLLKNAAGDVLSFTVLNQAGSMQITDMNNRRASVVIANSNNLSNRTIIHLIDNYLKYTY